MPNAFIKGLIAGALIVGALAGASTASANWTTNGSAGGTAFSDTAGAALLTVTATGAAAQGLSCTSASQLVTLTGPIVNFTLWDFDVWSFFGCRLVGQNAAVKCSGSSMFNGVTYAAPTTTGNLTGISCVVTKAACGNSTSVTGGITVTGTVNGSYNNTTAKLTISNVGQQLNVSWPSAGCLSGSSAGATGSLTDSAGASLVYSVTSSFVPNVTN
jgi:hypothetical protein